MEMIERQEPIFMQFAEGDSVQGVFDRVDRVAVGDKRQMCNRYIITDPGTGKAFCFLGTYQIDAKLRRGDIGHTVDIRFEGMDNSVSRGGNAMKKFKVLVSPKPYLETLAAANDLGITDADIPF